MTDPYASEPDPGPEDTTDAALVYADSYVPVDRHQVILVCQSAVRRRWQMTFPKSHLPKKVPCPKCHRPAYLEIVETTDQSSEFHWS